MKFTSGFLISLSVLVCSCGNSGSFYEPAVKSNLRAPAYPLITIDPYTSAWSFTDCLNEDVVRHWTGAKFPLLGVLRVDGVAYRFMGVNDESTTGKTVNTPAVQTSVSVLPTQTFYTFTCGAVELDVIFTSPLLLDELDLVSTPVNYISYRVKPKDGKEHAVQIYIEATPDWAINSPGQEVEASLHLDDASLIYAKTGTTEQPILQKKGDNVRIDWGYFYLVSEKKENKTITIGNDDNMKLTYCEDLGKISSSANGFVMLGYDDIYSIQYFQENRPAYWTHDGKMDIKQAFERAIDIYQSVMQKCAAFDERMMNDAEKSGGKEYAELCALAYRQAVSAHKLIEDKEGNLLFLSKENFSNGSIGTVDITYPSSPLFLLYNPDLLKGMLTPIFYYSESGQWNKPFPSHDIGTYPIANGQTYGDDMPIEESGNMLILTTAIAVVEGNAAYARKHWPVLTTWANYLLKEGFDPANQLCTDDFAGHLAHNANLSIKAIMGIAGYGKLAELSGDKETADKYIGEAKKMALSWEQMANDKDHYRLTFDQPGTWSQKYNLVWDKLLGLNVFSPEVAQKEIAWYLTKQNKYGLPLDSRKDYTKTDWIVWSACLADDINDFREIISPVHTYANETVSRIPLSDWHDTKDSHSLNFRARSVVGGYFMKMLEDKMLK
ncbi:MAG: DUF4965 domain-containing protein [Tannerellaceae bacterium]|nr:DUF4965 domain-containing protein [Tannerellaceae bacterium]